MPKEHDTITDPEILRLLAATREAETAINIILIGPTPDQLSDPQARDDEDDPADSDVGPWSHYCLCAGYARPAEACPYCNP